MLDIDMSPHLRCSTVEPSSAEMSAIEQTVLDYQQRTSYTCSDVTIPVCWHEIRRGEIGNITDADIDVQLDILNAALPATHLCVTTPVAPKQTILTGLM